MLVSPTDVYRILFHRDVTHTSSAGLGSDAVLLARRFRISTTVSSFGAFVKSSGRVKRLVANPVPIASCLSAVTSSQKSGFNSKASLESVNQIDRVRSEVDS